MDQESKKKAIELFESRKREIENFINHHPKGPQPTQVSKFFKSCFAFSSSVVEILQFMMSKPDKLSIYVLRFYSEYYAD